MAKSVTQERGDRIGRRRLYRAHGCGLAERNEVLIDGAIGSGEELVVHLYLGQRPKHGIQIVEGAPRYLVPGEPAAIARVEIKPAAAEGFFFEVAVSSPAPVREAAVVGDLKKVLLELADSRRIEFVGILDLLAGLVGLQFHRQFVLEQLDEMPFAIAGEVPIRSHYGPVMEILEPVKLKEIGIGRLEAVLAGWRDTSFEKLDRWGRILQWLLRAWQEDDAIYRFVALFVPMEAVLSMVLISDAERIRRVDLAARIRKAIAATGEAEKGELLPYFDSVVERAGTVPLYHRFRFLAEEWKLPGWEGDAEAFRQFSRMRNQLVHRGNVAVSERLTMGDEERTLSDIVERYVCRFIFGHPQVYRSRRRPEPSRDG